MPRSITPAILLIVAALGFSPDRTAAQEPSAAAIAKAQEVIEVTNANTLAVQVMTRTLSLQIEALSKANPKVPKEFWSEFERDFKAEVQNRVGELTTKIAKLYASSFSEQELDDLLVFYRSDTGRKAIREMPELTQKAMTLGGEWGREIGALTARRALEKLKKEDQ